jgi:hypothetical protein
VTEAVRDSARQLGIVLAAGVAGSLALGLLQERLVLAVGGAMLFAAGTLLELSL